MSMLGEQIKGLHEMAEAMHRRSHEIGLDYGMGRELANASRILREAADTIERLQELQGVASESRYTELFGTPERAAQTFEDFCDKCDKGECNDCPLDKLTDFCIGYDALLEWLRGDAE